MALVTERDLAAFIEQFRKSRRVDKKAVDEVLCAAGQTLAVKNRQLREASVQKEALTVRLETEGRRFTGDPREALRFLEPSELAEAASGAARLLVNQARQKEADTAQAVRTMSAAMQAALESRPDVGEIQALYQLSVELIDQLESDEY